MSNQEKCKHLLPCGYCDVKGAKCDVFYDQLNSQSIDNLTDITTNDLVNRQPQSNVSHIHDWDLVLAYYDPIEMIRKCQYRCKICGSSKTEADN